MLRSRSAPRALDIVDCASCQAEVRFYRTVTDQRTAQAFNLSECRSCGLVRVSDEVDESTYRRQYDGGTGVALADPLTNKTYDRWLAALEPSRKTGRLLEVGFGAGGFLKRAQRAGWEAYGTEVGDAHLPALAAAVPAERLYHGYLENAPFADGADGTFDVAVMLEVLEHLPAPGEVVDQLARLVRPGGAVFITVPNHDSLTRILSGWRWREYNPPSHLSYFTPRSLGTLFERRGFLGVDATTTGMNVVSLAEAAVGAIRRGRNPGIKDASADVAEKRQVAIAHRARVYRARQIAARLGPAKRVTNRLLSRIGRGDTIVMFARRADAP